MIFEKKNIFQNVVWKMAAIMSRLQYIKLFEMKNNSIVS